MSAPPTIKGIGPPGTTFVVSMAALGGAAFGMYLQKLYVDQYRDDLDMRMKARMERLDMDALVAERAAMNKDREDRNAG